MPARSLDAPAHGARLTLRTLGGMALVATAPDGTAETVLDAGKPLALLAYLACALDRSVSRERLLGLLWAHVTPAQGMNSLRVTLSNLRRLGPNVLGESVDPVVLTAPITLDRDELLAAWDRHELTTVLDLYRGEFLPAFAHPGAAAFEQWADTERARLRSIFREAAGELVRTRLARALFHEAEALATRVRDRDVRDEHAWHLLFECLLASRNNLRAAVEVAELERLLAEDQSDPDPSTAELLAKLRRMGAPKTGSAADTPLIVEVVGRERQFAAILAAWEQAREGRAMHLHVTAPAGLGKTRLLNDVRTRLREKDATVVKASAKYGTRDLGYALASDIAKALGKRPGAGGVAQGVASTLVALNPALSDTFSAPADPAVGEEAVLRRQIALRELITAIAEDDPLALLIDDLHWSDPLSLRLLEATLPALNRTSVLVVTTSRSSPGDARIAAGATEIALQRLAEPDVATLLSSVATLPDEEWARQLPGALHTATRGSPLLVLETLEHLKERGLLSYAGQEWKAPGDAEQAFTALGERSALQRRVDTLAGTQRTVLLLLAVAGIPVSDTLLREAARNPGDFDASLAALEQRGFATVRSNHWSTAHDEHAAAITGVATSDELQSARSAMGCALADHAGNDTRLLRLAASLLARSNDVHGLTRLYPRFEQALRHDGDARSTRLLVREFIGSTTASDLEQQILRALPWRTRVGHRTPFRLAMVAASALLLLLVGWVAWNAGAPPAPAPVATLLLRRHSADGRMQEFVEFPLDAERLASATAIDVDVNARPKWRIADSVMQSFSQSLAPRPDGRGWAGARSLSDSGVLDVFDLRTDGSARRLTFARKDDIEGGWSPDGRYLAFMTMRSTTYGHYDVAVYDTLTRGVRRLTGPDDDADVGPRWSPDGSRIAFSRRVTATGETKVCVTDVDGTHLHCGASRVGQTMGLLGWTDAHRLLLELVHDGSNALVRFDVDSGEETIVRTDAGGVYLSPDARYALCTCAYRRYAAGTQFIFAVDAPDALMVVRYRPPSAAVDNSVTLGWSPTSPIQPYVTSLRVLRGPGAPVTDVPYMLRAAAVDKRDEPLEVGAVRWRVLDTTTATVDSNGVLRARRTGPVTVEASAGGWRSAQVTLQVVAPSMVRTLLDEGWTHGLEPTWVLFGEPKPAIEPSERFGTAFNNNGDGSFWSGAYTAGTFDATGGLWLEAELSVPLTKPGPSQDQLVGLFAMIDSLQWKTWDHISGDHKGARRCRIRYPASSDNPMRGDSLSIEAVATDEKTFHVPRPLRDGQPFKTLVQIFPDGRCGFAVDGEPLYISPPAYFDSTARAMLVGNTQETHILVGRVGVHAGIAPFVPWEKLEMRRPTGVGTPP